MRRTAAPSAPCARSVCRSYTSPHPDYVKVQAFAAVGLVAALQDVGMRVADLGRQVMLASRRWLASRARRRGPVRLSFWSLVRVRRGRVSGALVAGR